MTDIAKVEGDEIVMRIKISDLNGAAWQGLSDVDPEIDDRESFDYTTLAEDMVSELNNESEDGSTPVHKLLDEAVTAAADNGSEAFAYLDGQ